MNWKIFTFYFAGPTSCGSAQQICRDCWGAGGRGEATAAHRPQREAAAQVTSVSQPRCAGGQDCARLQPQILRAESDEIQRDNTVKEDQWPNYYSSLPCHKQILIFTKNMLMIITNIRPTVHLATLVVVWVSSTRVIVILAAIQCPEQRGLVTDTFWQIISFLPSRME